MTTQTTQQLFENLRQATLECIDVPNGWLPPSYQDNRHNRKGRNLADVERMADERDAQRVDRQRAKNARVSAYAEMVARGEEIQYIDG